MKVTSATKIVRKPLPSDLDLYVDGSLGNASSFSGTGTKESSFAKILSSSPELAIVFHSS